MPTARTKVVVIDTGMPNGVHGIPSGALDKGSPFAPASSYISLPLPGDANAGHGTIVASLVLGGPNFLAVDENTSLRALIKMVNVDKMLTIATPAGSG